MSDLGYSSRTVKGKKKSSISPFSGLHEWQERKHDFCLQKTETCFFFSNPTLILLASASSVCPGEVLSQLPPRFFNCKVFSAPIPAPGPSGHPTWRWMARQTHPSHGPQPKAQKPPSHLPIVCRAALKPLGKGMPLTYRHHEQLLPSLVPQRGQQRPPGTSASLNSTSNKVSRVKNTKTAAQGTS